MGLPLRDDSSCNASAAAMVSTADADSCNGISEPPTSVQHVFVYGNSRPDITPAVVGGLGAQTKRAWLLGSRLYSCNSGATRRAALRLQEPGHAVLGYTVSIPNRNDFGRLLDTFENREYNPEYYDRDIVEVVTEAGERVQSFVYHKSEVDQSNPVQGGDWLKHIQP